MEFFIYHFQQFLLVFVRIMGMVYIAPIYSSEAIMDEAKLTLTFFITIIIFPLVSSYLPAIPPSIIGYVLVAVSEGLIGIILGFMLTISFSVYQLAGQYFTVQMGFGASEVFDPMSQISLPLMGQYLYLLAILVFLSLQGPIMILKELFLSFQLVTADSFLRGSIAFENYGMIATFIEMFSVALRMSFPIIGTLLIVSVAMGLLAKAAPQMNLLMIGFPISIAISFILMIVILPGLILFFEEYIDSMFKNIWYLMDGLKR